MNKSFRHKVLALGALVFVSSLSTASFAQDDVDVADSQGVSLTIYNQNFGLVRDVRNMALKDGVNVVRFSDVASQIDPTSVSLQSLSTPNSIQIRELYPPASACRGCSSRCYQLRF
jgi:hypothetical protein